MRIHHCPRIEGGREKTKGRTWFLGGVGGFQGQELKTEEVASHQPLLLVQPLDGSYLTIQGHSAA